MKRATPTRPRLSPLEPGGYTMNLKIIALLLILFFAVFSGSAGADNSSRELKLSVLYDSRKKEVKVVLQNISDQPVKVNSQMTLGPTFGPLNELAFEIFDEQKRPLKLTAKLHPTRAGKEDVYLLKSREKITRSIDIMYLAGVYSLRSGTYVLRARYQNRTLDDVNSEILWSEPVKVTVHSDS